VTPLTVTPDIERAPWHDLLSDVQIGMVGRIGLLRHATRQGKAGVAVVIELPDGTRVIGETTWALFRTAFAALAASPVVAEEVIDP
jgi:hypothetical protein